MPEWYKRFVLADVEEDVANSSTGLQALAKLRSSRAFSKSPRLSSLLDFIVVHSIRGRTEELTEQQIGIQVFGRAAGYNSSEDTIVRVTARHLRQRLEQYYASEGATDPVRIDIPRGGYVACFQESLPAVAFEPAMPFVPTTAAPAPSAAPLKSRLLLGVLPITVAVLTATCAALAVAYVHLRTATQRPPAPTGPVPLWQAMFTPDRKTLVVPGDGSLDAFVAWEQRSVPLEAYTSQTYQRQATVSIPPTHRDVPLSTRSVTPMADLALVTIVMRAADRLSALQPTGPVELRYARDLAVSDTHDNNLVLIGSETFNPWVTLYQPQMDFAAHFDFAHDVYRMVNRQPKPGEQSVYEYVRQASPSQQAITHIALLNNGQGGGRVLIVEGTSMGTTYGAVNFLTHDALWQPVLRQATSADGRLHDFEILLSGDFFHGGMGNTHLLALHVH